MAYVHSAASPNGYRFVALILGFLICIVNEKNITKYPIVISTKGVAMLAIAVEMLASRIDNLDY